MIIIIMIIIIGMFEAEMSSDAWQIAGMSDRLGLGLELGIYDKGYG
jgi:hypothetical protein